MEYGRPTLRDVISRADSCISKSYLFCLAQRAY